MVQRFVIYMVTAILTTVCVEATAGDRTACPYFPATPPDAQGFQLWYAPFCQPHSGAVGLLLPAGSNPSYCPGPAGCITGLPGDSEPVSIIGRDELNEGYPWVAGPRPWNEELQWNPAVKLSVDDYYLTMKAPADTYVRVVRVNLPQQRVLIGKFRHCDGTEEEEVEVFVPKTSFIAGWQVSRPDSDHIGLFKRRPELQIFPLDGQPKVGKVAFRDSSDPIITEVLLWSGRGPEHAVEPKPAK